eukprot:GHVU01035482.1.p1 GENE.GHVU01035482.1~~GHVU01035482.1.p1  ORF type:complete len:375 (-),score=69.41 GHVU01035482.1:1973-3097(-)
MRGHSTVETVMKEYTTRHNKKMTYTTNVVRGSRQLLMIWAADRDLVSTVFYEIWTKPLARLPAEHRSLSSVGGSGLHAADEAILLEYRIHDVEELGTKTFGLTATDVRGRKRLLPSLLLRCPAPATVTTPMKTHHFIRSIPFTETNDGAWWLPTDFFLQARKGTAFDHCLLHASLLIGLHVPAFVCLGTLWNRQRHAWLLTLELPEATGGDPKAKGRARGGRRGGTSSLSGGRREAASSRPGGDEYRVAFWDTAKNGVYVLPKRLLDPHGLIAFTQSLNRTTEAVALELRTALTLESKKGRQKFSEKAKSTKAASSFGGSSRRTRSTAMFSLAAQSMYSVGTTMTAVPGASKKHEWGSHYPSVRIRRSVDLPYR